MDREGGELGETGVEHDRAAENWEDFKYNLHLFEFLHRAFQHGASWLVLNCSVEELEALRWRVEC